MPSQEEARTNVEGGGGEQELALQNYREAGRASGAQGKRCAFLHGRSLRKQSEFRPPEEKRAA